MKTINMKKSLCLILALFALLSILTVGVFATVDAEAPAEGDMSITEVGGTDESDVTTDVSEGEENKAPAMIFEPSNFVKNLDKMGIGMLGIFVVIGVIIIVTALLNKVFKDKKED